MILLTATTLPGKELPKIGINDKIEHLTAYFILSILLSLSLFFQNKYRLFKKYFAIATLSIISIYAALDELHQLFIPGRTCDFYDWLADFTGAAIGVFIVFIFLKKFHYNSKEN